MCCWARHYDAHLLSTNTDTDTDRGIDEKIRTRRHQQEYIWMYLSIHTEKTLLLWTLLLKNELINHFNIWHSSKYYLLANLLRYHNPYLLRKKNSIIKSDLQNSLCFLQYSCMSWILIRLLRVRCVCHVFTYSHHRAGVKFPTCV